MMTAKGCGVGIVLCLFVKLCVAPSGLYGRRALIASGCRAVGAVPLKKLAYVR